MIPRQHVVVGAETAASRKREYAEALWRLTIIVQLAVLDAAAILCAWKYLR